MIGILTFTNTINYGAVLQAYALQKKLRDFNVKNEVIRYHCKAISEREAATLKGSIKSPKNLIKYILVNRHEKKKREKFDAFERNNMSFSSFCYDRENIKEACNRYDGFVAGSDQIWNLNITGGDYTFFLDFEPEKSKKMSYAGSFGYSKIPEPYQERCAKLLADFTYITVREQAGKDIITRLTGEEVPVVLDPTLLLNGEEWLQLVGNGRKSNPYGDYILLYFIHNKKETLRFARSLSKETGCRLVYVNISPKPGIGMLNLHSPSPIEFLSLIYHAKYVITGSFHGTAFSINFNKQFFFEKVKNPMKYNSRIENLVAGLKLEDREVGLQKDWRREIDYTKKNRILEDYRKESLMHLKRMVSDKGLNYESFKIG